MEFQGHIHSQKQGTFAKLIFPLVQVKKLFEVIYSFLLQTIWSELFEGKKLNNDTANFIAFIAFCLLSLIVFYIQDYISIILMVSFVIWYIDVWFAKKYYLESPTLTATLTSLDEDTLQWRMTLPTQKAIQSKFTRNQIKEIGIVSRQVYGGAFEESLGIVWQIEIHLYDGAILLIHEEKTALNALKTAKTLANAFQVALFFADTEGNGDYAEKAIAMDSLETQGIIVQKTPSKWHIGSKWRLSHSWQLLKQILKKSGFFLFLVMMTGFMIKFGGYVNFILANYLNINIGNYSIPGLLAWLEPEFELIDIIELAIAILLIIYQGFRMSQEKHIYIDQFYLKYFINNRKIAQLNTSNIESVLLVKHPEISILVLGEGTEITITNLQQEKEYKAMLLQIADGIMQFHQ